MIRTTLPVCFMLWYGAAFAAGVEVWPVDPLVKVFRDDAPTTLTPAPFDAARGEHASWQIVVRAPQPITGLRATVGDFAHFDNLFPALRGATAHFVGYVSVDRPAQTPARNPLRTPPAVFPDPLLEIATIGVPADANQPIWVTLAVPPDANGTLYQAPVRIEGSIAGETFVTSATLSLRVHPVTIARTRLWVEDWFQFGGPHQSGVNNYGSEEWWAALGRFARMMGEYRRNVVMVSPLEHADFSVARDGAPTVDFARFDRWIDTFERAGVRGRIAGMHLGHRVGDWQSPFVIDIRETTGSQVRSRPVAPDSPEAERFCGWFLPRLRDHLAATGRLDRYMQHLADEPIAANRESYRAMAVLVRRHAPELKIIEAVQTTDLVGAVNVWVPVLDHLHRDHEKYRARQAAGEEVWFYTCISPQGEYANRFIEQPLLLPRLLHWINYRYGVTGYLHWGWNQWRNASPFVELTPPLPGSEYLPAGDAWIVYPGTERPIASIRLEATRDGIVDHELLSMLAERDPDAAARLAARHVLGFDRYDINVERFRATRRELLERLSPGRKQ